MKPTAKRKHRATGLSWRTRLAEPGWLLLPLRMFLGVTFTFAGLQKLADPAYLDPASPTSVQHQLAALVHTSPIGALLSLFRPHTGTIGVLIALGEISVGTGTLLGLWARLAAVGGALLSLTFLLTVSWHTWPYYYGSDIVFAVMWLPFTAVGSAGVLSLDAWLGRMPDHDPGRRAWLRHGVTIGFVAVAALATAGLTAWIGRAVGGRAVPRWPMATAMSGDPAGDGETTVVRLDEIDQGSAKRFIIPQSGEPAWLIHLPAGGFAAFSAVCTHAGCAVDFNISDQEFSCPCHGAVYSAASGAVLGGPAPAPLTRLPVHLRGDFVRVG
ncbi:TQO small subunit DoxD [Protofrankia symbiont of Coriaria ruscifolia]|uniref:TQO small subunit DoxD n=1 Tax=Protofrankia symbiont of Coriaria ruscifolia TaxID=1306542 RepID=UPI001041B36C|nr:TQO small subunit DoxD [Protofrankia symbiont of Coriaria ruscifolia]